MVLAKDDGKDRARQVGCGQVLAGQGGAEMVAVGGEPLPAALALRAAVGVCLAGVYPLGMKLVVTWVPDRAGAALGWLVGALTFGTATPFLVRGLGEDVPWRAAVLTSSVLAALGGLAVVLQGEGPARKAGARLGRWPAVHALWQGLFALDARVPAGERGSGWLVVARRVAVR